MALMDITEDAKEPLFNLIKEDYEKIKETKYYQDYLDNLGPKKRKFFLDVIKFDNYEEFKKENPDYWFHWIKKILKFKIIIDFEN